MTDISADLDFLIGEPMNSVCFVMDYVELHFNGSYLRCLEPPTIVPPGAPAATFPEAGSRDALCALIGASVRDIRASIGDTLRIEFDNDAVITTSLSNATSGSAEVLHIHNQATGETQWW